MSDKIKFILRVGPLYWGLPMYVLTLGLEWKKLLSYYYEQNWSSFIQDVLVYFILVFMASLLFGYWSWRSEQKTKK